MIEGTEAVKEAKKFVERNKADLIISDVPTKSLNLFKKLADEEFKCKGGKGHYGFTLKYLLDFYFGRVVDGSKIAEAKAEEALLQIAEMKDEMRGSVPQEEKKTITMCDGTERRIK